MKKLILFMMVFGIIFVGIGSALNITYPTAGWTTSGGNNNALTGWKIDVLAHINILNITKESSDTMNMAYLMNEDLTIIANSSFIGNTALFPTTLLSPGTYYLLGNRTSGAIKVNKFLGVTLPDSYEGIDLIESLDNGGSNVTNRIWGIREIYYEVASSTTTLNSPLNNIAILNNPITLNITATPLQGLNLTNITFYIWNSTSLVNQTFRELTGNVSNTTTLDIDLDTGNYIWNAESCQSFGCSFALSNETFFRGLNIVNNLFNSEVSQTSSQFYNTTFSVTSGTPTANLYWNNTKTTGTIVTLTPTLFRAKADFDIPLVNDSIPLFWSITTLGKNYNLTSENQLVNSINFTICQASPQNVPYINFTFKNETISQEDTNANIPSAIFSYYLGTGLINKTLTYSNATENPSYAFCFTPSDKTLKSFVDIDYTNSESQQRTFNPSGAQTYTNATTNQTLFLLPTTKGIFVTFQVVNTAQQPLKDVLITLERSGFGTIFTGKTSSSGTITIFLDPNAEYTLTASKTGFTSFTTTQTFTTTEFTITLGGQGITNDDLTRGIFIDIKPTPGFLNNGTTYNFNMTLNSTFWALDSYGFNLTNSSGAQLSFQSDTTQEGGFVSDNVNTGTNKLLTMEYFWIINGTRSDAQVSWTIETPGDGSIAGFFNLFKTYVGQGIFGITNFGMVIIAFLIVFLTVGILTFKFGITNNITISFIIFALVLFVDRGLGLIPDLDVGGRIISSAIVTGMAFLLVVVSFIWEMR